MIAGAEQSLAAVPVLQQHAEARRAGGGFRGGGDRKSEAVRDAARLRPRLGGELFEPVRVVHRQNGQPLRRGAARRRPVDVVDRRVFAQRALRRSVFEKKLQLVPRRALRRAQQARHGEGAAGIGIGAAGGDGFAAQPPPQKARHEGVARAEHVIDIDGKARAALALFDVVGNRAGEDDAAHRPALADDDRARRRADISDRAQCVLVAARDMQLLLRADDEVAERQDGAEMRGDAVGPDIARLARAMAREAPEIGPVVDIEYHFAAVLFRQPHRLLLRRVRIGAGEMRAGDDDGGGLGDEILVDVAFIERRVGAVGAVENQRKRPLVAHAEDDERGEARGIGAQAARVDALARELLADEAAHMLVADAADQRRPEAEPRRADGDVGGTAPDGLGETGHVLEPPADLLAVEIDRRAADGDDVEPPVSASARHPAAAPCFLFARIEQ